MATSSVMVSKRIYSGSEADELVIALAARRSDGELGAGESVTTGIQYIDDNNPPQMRGDTIILEGLTSHGKSLVASTMGSHTLSRLGNSGSRALLVAMTEETVESRHILGWGDPAITIQKVLTGETSLERINAHIKTSPNKPIYYIGQTASLEDVGTNNGVLRVSNIAEAINQLLRRNIEPEQLIIDHAHDLWPNDKFRDEQGRQDAVADELNKLTSALGQYCPTIILCQCVKEVEKRPITEFLPNAYDLKNMQALAAKARDIYSIGYPVRKGGVGKEFPTVHGKIRAYKGTFLLHVPKARYGQCAGDTIAMSALDDEGQWTNMLRETTGGFA